MQQITGFQERGQIQHFGGGGVCLAWGGGYFGKQGRGIRGGKWLKRFLQGFLFPIGQRRGPTRRAAHGPHQLTFRHLHIARRCRRSGIVGAKEHQPEHRRVNGGKGHHRFTAIGCQKGVDTAKSLTVIGGLHFPLARPMAGATCDVQSGHGDRPGESDLQPFGPGALRALTGGRPARNPKSTRLAIRSLPGRMFGLAGTGGDRKIHYCPSRLAIGHDGNIAIKTIADLGGGQLQLHLIAAGYPGFRPDILFGGIRRGHNRPAQIPAALNIEADFESQPVRLAECVFIKFTPGRREKRRAVRHRAVIFLRGAAGIKNHRAAKALGFHLLKIVRDGSGGDIAVKPPPVGAQPRHVWRILPPLLQRRRQGTDSEGEQQQQGKG